MKRHSLMRHSRFVAAFLMISAVFAILGFVSYLGETDNVAASSKLSENIAVVIDAGHGGEDGGAVGVSGTLEKDINLNIAKMIYDLFAITDIDAVMTRTDDYLLYEESQSSRKKYFDVRNRVELANKFSSPVFLSIHQNKFPIAKYKGLQVYFSGNNSDSKIVAECIQNKTKIYLQKDNNRMIKQGGRNIFVLQNLECPAVLVECGFLSNPEDEANLNNPEYQKQIAFIIFSSVIDYINDKYKL